MRGGVVGLVAAGLLLAACGGSDQTAGPSSTTTSPTASASASPTTASATPEASPSATRSGPPEPTPVGDTSADGLWGRAAEVICAGLLKQGSPPSDRAAAAEWLRDRAWNAVDQLEAVSGNGNQGKEMRDIMYAIGTQSAILATVYRTGNGDAAGLEQAIADSTARLGRYAAALRAPSCAAVVSVA